MIQIKLNGKQYKLRSGITLSNLLNLHHLEHNLVGIELNNKIINQNDFNRMIIRNSDDIEIVEFVGGG
ncbi:MAG: sulfur carrier protein ThiS [Rickettsiales bacterium]|mgnify:FL=1|jgi:sulfur carrier protein|nr:sulfur carrier protein ThiS [Rickettsiales bacterium]